MIHKRRRVSCVLALASLTLAGALSAPAGVSAQENSGEGNSQEKLKTSQSNESRNFDNQDNGGRAKDRLKESDRQHGPDGDFEGGKPPWGDKNIEPPEKWEQAPQNPNSANDGVNQNSVAGLNLGLIALIGAGVVGLIGMIAWPILAPILGISR